MSRELLLVSLLALLLYIPALGSRDLWNPNEPLYATVVAEMSARGNWVVPVANGEPFGEKPILYFWLALCSSALLGGVSELSLRLPAALSGVALVVGTALLVEPYAGRRRASLAAILVGTSFVVFWSARQVQMDLTLAACTLGALVAASRVLDHQLGRWVGWSLVGTAVGCGLLVKGPVGAICPALAILGYVTVSGRWRELCDRALCAAVVSTVVIAAPWYVALWARGKTSLLEELLFRQNLRRFFSAWDHAASWWYYLGYVWIDLLPWSPLLVLAVGLAPAHEGERKLHRLAWVWLIAIVFFFSLSASKRSPYILPVAPAVAVLVAAVVDRALTGQLETKRKNACSALLGALAVAVLVVAAITLREAGKLRAPVPLEEIGEQIAAMLALTGGAIGVAALWFRRSPVRAGLMALGAVVAIYLLAAITVLPRADAFKSPRPMAESIVRLVPGSSPLAGFHAWRWRADWSFYAGREIPVIQDLGRLTEYWNRDERVYLVVERGLIGQARTVIGSRAPLAYHEAGSNAVYLFSNERGAQAE